MSVKISGVKQGSLVHLHSSMNERNGYISIKRQNFIPKHTQTQLTVGSKLICIANFAFFMNIPLCHFPVSLRGKLEWCEWSGEWKKCAEDFYRILDQLFFYVLSIRKWLPATGITGAIFRASICGSYDLKLHAHVVLLQPTMGHVLILAFLTLTWVAC